MTDATCDRCPPGRRIVNPERHAAWHAEAAAAGLPGPVDVTTMQARGGHRPITPDVRGAAIGSRRRAAHTPHDPPPPDTRTSRD